MTKALQNIPAVAVSTGAQRKRETTETLPARVYVRFQRDIQPTRQARVLPQSEQIQRTSY